MDPSQAPPEAPVFWLPHEDTSVIVLGGSPAALFGGTASQPTIQAAVTVAGEGETYLRYDLGSGQHVQLVHAANGSSEEPLGAFVPLGPDGFDRLESIGRLLASLHGRAVPPATRLTRQQRARLRRMLQAFDGYRAGATQQEIARVIFRLGAFDRDDWQESSARHAIKALIRDSRAMIQGGYRSLLRHRRKRR